VCKLAPIAMESPQLQHSFCGLASEDLEWKAGCTFPKETMVPLQMNLMHYGKFIILCG